MRKFITTLIIIFFLSSLFPFNAKAESVMKINDLIEHAKELDGKEVTVQGEAIGECMDRGDYSWININDGTNAIGIWLSKSDADTVLHYGNYKYIGDTVKVTGIFYRSCKEHGGEADLHSNLIKIVKSGYKVKEQVSATKIITAIILILATILIIVFRGKRIKAKNL